MPSRQCLRSMLMVVAGYLPFCAIGLVHAQQQAPEAWLTQSYNLSDAERESVPTMCPGWLGIEARIVLLVGHAPTEEVHFAITLARRESAHEGTVYEARILRHVRDQPHNERVLRDVSCDDLSEAVAIVVALTLDQTATARTLAEESRRSETTENPVDSDAPETVEESSMVPSPAAPPATSMHARRPWPLTASIAATSHSHLLPRLGLGGVLDIGTAIDAFEIRAGFSVLAPVRAVNEARVGAEIGAWSVFVGAGYSIPLSQQLSLVPGVALEFGELFGHGVGVTPSRHGSAPWFAVAVSGEFRWHPTPEFGLFLRAAPRVLPLRPIFYLENVGEIFQPSVVDMSLSLGFRVAFSVAAD